MTYPDSWEPDICGPDFAATTLDLGTDPEGEGEVVATLVRYLPGGTPPPNYDSRPALLWVHGMSDYFFQDHVARHFFAAGYAFYAVDLRKCGRSHRGTQRWHSSLDLAHYFPDLDQATIALSARHRTIIPLAHSTGGLIVPLWLAYLRATNPQLAKHIAGLILNSPWLDMQFPAPVTLLARIMTATLGKRWPHLIIPGNSLSAYGISIHADHQGHWEFDTQLKPLGGVPKSFGWLRAILAGQRQLHAGLNLEIPILTLCSSRSYLGHPYSPLSASADTVLDVAQIRRWAPTLGERSTTHIVPGALHDVFLSLPLALADAYRACEGWLVRNIPPSPDVRSQGV